MSETYCGKNCGECMQKETLNCPGCKAGPGRQLGGDCRLAKCVRDKGHETCDTCGFRSNCNTLRVCGQMPEERLKEIKSEEMRKADIAKRAPVLGKWLWFLFWLIVPSTVGSFMTNDTIAEFLPGLYLPGMILNTICSLITGGILLKLGSVEGGYHTAGICFLIAGGVGVVTALFTGTGEAGAWTLIFTIPAAIVALVGEFNEFLAHSIVLTGVDNELSEKWTTLWKWYIGLMLGMFGCILIMLILPLLGVIALLGAAIGLLVTSVLKLVYLYRTAKIFREYSTEV